MKLFRRSGTRKNDIYIGDEESDLLLKQVESLLREDNELEPQQATQKQILAFAHRELKTNHVDTHENKSYDAEIQFSGHLNSKQWWRRLALPTFGAGSFALTIFAFQSLWQPLLDDSNRRVSSMSDSVNAEQQIEQPIVEFSVSESDQLSRHSTLSSSKLKREESAEQALKELNENQKMPSADRRLADANVNSDETVKDLIVRQGFISVESSTNEAERVSDLEKQNIYTGSELSKSIYPEKEIWATKIVALYEESKNTEATRELKAFKKAYPNFPIDDRLKPYLR
ncbi:MAG: hypothetical protein ACPGJI_02605 [Kangiellaceae bacterium]